MMTVLYAGCSDTDASDVAMGVLCSRLISDGVVSSGELGQTRGRVTSGRFKELGLNLVEACCKPGESILMFLPGTCCTIHYYSCKNTHTYTCTSTCKST